MNKIVVALVAFFALAPLCTLADSLPESNHTISNMVVIENASVYPNFNFYLTFGSGKIPGSIKLSEKPTEVFNGNAVGTIIAVHQNNEKLLKSGVQENCPECGDSWYTLPENKKLIVPSKLVLSFDGYVPDENPAQKITQIVHIYGVSNLELDAKQVGTRTINSEGELVQPVNAQNNSAQRAATSSMLPSLLITLGIICLGILGIIKSKKMFKPKTPPTTPVI